MDKKVLLIGNDAGLPGVKVDMKEYRKFFTGAYGGNWNEDEIIEIVNGSKVLLELRLTWLKMLELDYLVVVFSGHGGEKRGTVLEINSQEEQINESELQNIAKRQLNIYDCCRCYSEELTKGMLAVFESKASATVNTRARFEARIAQAAHQQVRLYACSVGEYAYDTSEGAAYSKNLLSSAMNKDRQFTLVGEAHSEAKALTTATYGDQHPDAILPKCLASQQLILGIRP